MSSVRISLAKTIIPHDLSPSQWMKREIRSIKLSTTMRWHFLISLEKISKSTLDRNYSKMCLNAIYISSTMKQSGYVMAITGSESYLSWMVSYAIVKLHPINSGWNTIHRFSIRLMILRVSYSQVRHNLISKVRLIDYSVEWRSLRMKKRNILSYSIGLIYFLYGHRRRLNRLDWCMQHMGYSLGIRWVVLRIRSCNKSFLKWMCA